MRVKAVALGLLLILAVSACKEERPDYVISEQRLESFLYDYHMANAILSGMDHPSANQREAFYDHVLEKHNLTKEEFDTSMTWYSLHPDVMQDMYLRITKKVSNTIQSINDKIERRGAQTRMTQEGDSINIWPGMPMYLLRGTKMDRNITFAVGRDRNFQDTDTLRLTLEAKFIGGLPKDSLLFPVMTLNAQYSRSDTVIGRQIRIDHSGKYEITIDGQGADNFQKTFGFIYYPTDDGKNPLLVSDISLMRYHKR